MWFDPDAESLGWEVIAITLLGGMEEGPGGALREYPPVALFPLDFETRTEHHEGSWQYLCFLLSPACCGGE
jgi:hypothetical protein